MWISINQIPAFLLLEFITFKRRQNQTFPFLFFLLSILLLLIFDGLFESKLWYFVFFNALLLNFQIQLYVLIQLQMCYLGYTTAFYLLYLKNCFNSVVTLWLYTTMEHDWPTGNYTLKKINFMSPSESLISSEW